MSRDGPKIREQGQPPPFDLGKEAASVHPFGKTFFMLIRKTEGYQWSDPILN